MRAYTPAAIERARALTVCQPYSHLIALGKKPLENREHDRFKWYRGVLLIHAGKSRRMLGEDDEARYPLMPYGAIESIAWFERIVPVESLPPELRNHEHAFGPWCMVLEDVVRLPRPVHCSGEQGLWIPSREVVAAVIEQVEAAA